MARTTKRSSGSGTDEQEINDSGTTTIEKPAVAAGAAKVPEISPELRAKLAEIRGRIEASVGQAVLLMMELPRYRHQALGDLNRLIVEPLLRDRIAIAYAKAGGDQPQSNRGPVGLTFWASVNDEVDTKIRDQVKAGVFPLRLDADDWNSGEKLWLLDIVAPTKRAASAVLVNFRNIAEGRQVQLHPVVVGSVDGDLLNKLREA